MSGKADGAAEPAVPAADEDAAAAGESSTDPGEVIDMVSGLVDPLMQAGMAIPSTLMGLGSGLLAPFGQILGLFGQGTPATPSTEGVPPQVLEGLDNTDAGTGMTGTIGPAYQSDVDAYASQAHTWDEQEKQLHATVEESAATTESGRERIQQIIERMKSVLQSMGPLASTPMGQLGLLSTFAQGLQEATGVLTETLGKAASSAGTVNPMAQLQTETPPDEQQQQQILKAGGVDAWILQGLAANGITDPRAIANWMRGLREVAQRASGNDPAAVEAAGPEPGDPSLGLMGLMQPTFDAHWRPGTEHDPLNPVSSVAAAVHYVMTTYDVTTDGSNLVTNVLHANPYVPS